MDNELMKRVIAEENRLDAEEHGPTLKRWLELGRLERDFKTGYGKPITELSYEELTTLGDVQHEVQIEKLSTDENAAGRHGKRSDEYYRYRMPYRAVSAVGRKRSNVQVGLCQ